MVKIAFKVTGLSTATKRNCQMTKIARPIIYLKKHLLRQRTSQVKCQGVKKTSHTNNKHKKAEMTIH